MMLNIPWFDYRGTSAADSGVWGPESARPDNLSAIMKHMILITESYTHPVPEEPSDVDTPITHVEPTVK